MSVVIGAEPSNGNIFIPDRAPSPISSNRFAPEPGSRVAPTVSTRRPEPGDPTVDSPVRLVGVGLPEFPAATTTVAPANVALSQAIDVGKFGSLTPFPKLRLITLATGFG